MDEGESSTGLATQVAAPLAYAGWWLTGLIFWLLERRDEVVRFHAAQALAAFGGLAVLIAGLGAMAIASLSFLPSLFDALIVAAEAAALLSVVLWLVSIWQVASGRDWRIPIAAGWAERMTRVRASGPAAS
jgi:uncharacterized membrane protein